MKLQNAKEKFPHFAVKKIQHHFLSLEFTEVTHLQNLRKFCWLAMIVKLKKGQKNSKIKSTNKFYQILLKFVIILTSEPIHNLKTTQYPYFKP